LLALYKVGGSVSTISTRRRKIISVCPDRVDEVLGGASYAAKQRLRYLQAECQFKVTAGWRDKGFQGLLNGQ
jgi:hypothetical protein